MSKPTKSQGTAPEPDFDYGLSASELYAALRLENRTDPNAETASKNTSMSKEFLEEHFSHLIVRHGPRLPTMTRKNSLDINTGRAQPSKKTKTA